MSNFTDTLIPGEIVTVSLRDYMNLLNSSADLGESSDLIEMIFRNKIFDSCMGPIIDSLMDYGFTVPIELQIIDDGMGPIYSQGNGHHRLVAAILLGIDRIPVKVNAVSSSWDIDFASTEDNDGNAYYCGKRELTLKGEESRGAWSDLLYTIYQELW